MKSSAVRIGGLKWLVGCMCVTVTLELAFAQAQQEQGAGRPAESGNGVLSMPETGEGPGKTGGEFDIYEDLWVREEQEAERRLEIIRMRGEADRLSANTEELNAKTQNCKARRNAYEAGADVHLCKNDEGAVRRQEAATDESADTHTAEPYFAVIENRLVELENRLTGAAERAPANILQVSDDIWPEPEKSEFVLVLLDSARAVVQYRITTELGEELRTKNAFYRIPFEARLEGSDCIRTVKALGGVEVGKRICRS